MSRIVVSKKRKRKSQVKPQYDWERFRSRAFTAYEARLNKMKTYEALAKHMYPPIDWRLIQRILEETKGIEVGEPTAKKLKWMLENHPEVIEERRRVYRLAEETFNLKNMTGLTVSESLAILLVSSIIKGKMMKKLGVKKATKEIEEKAIDQTWDLFFNDWEKVMEVIEASRLDENIKEKFVDYIRKL